MFSSPDPLFGLRNNFYLGACQAAINNSNVPNLSQEDAIERDSLVYRSYITLGSYQLVISRIHSSAPTALPAVKLFAMYLFEPGAKEAAVASLHGWLSDSTIASNPILRLIAGNIHMHEQDYNKALKHTQSAGNMELRALDVRIYLKMHRLSWTVGRLQSLIIDVDAHWCGA